MNRQFKAFRILINKNILIKQFSTNQFKQYENRNLLKLKERGLVVNIFPDQL